MRLTPFTTCAFFLLMTSGLLAQQGAVVVPSPVEVWCGGDDGLTQKVCGAAEQAFKSARDFPLRKAEGTAKYKVIIPSNVDWKKVHGRIQILFTVELQNADAREVGRFKGSCSESKVRLCGKQILQGTRSLLATTVPITICSVLDQGVVLYPL